MAPCPRPDARNRVGVDISRLQHRVPDVAVVRAGSFESVYAGFGIPSYWIVEPDPKRPELIVLELRSGTYEISPSWSPTT